MSEDDVEVISKSGRALGKIGVIDSKKLVKLKYRKGWTNTQIAEHFGVSVQAVGQMLGRVRKEAIGNLYSRAKDMADEQISVQMLVVGLMSDAADILKDVKESVRADAETGQEAWDKMSIEKRKLQLATMAEIRAQISSYSAITDKLYSVEAHAEFQRLVVDTIRNEAPDVAEKIIQRLQQQQPLREFIGGTRRAS